MVASIKVDMETGISEKFISVSSTFDKNILQAMRTVAPMLVESLKSNFDAKGARGGKPGWKITKNPNPLVDKGDLKNSFKSSVDKEGDDFVVVIGTDKDYAQILNEGGVTSTDVIYDPSRSEGGSLWRHTTTFRQMDIPKREFMFIVPDDVVKALELMRDKKVDRMKLVSHEYPIEEAGQAFDIMCQVDNSVKVVVKL